MEQYVRQSWRVHRRTPVGAVLVFRRQWTDASAGIRPITGVCADRLPDSRQCQYSIRSAAAMRTLQRLQNGMASRDVVGGQCYTGGD